MNNKYKIAVIGLGYVGLPLAIEFAKKYRVVGFDINQKRISELKTDEDSTLEADMKSIIKASGVNFQYGLEFSSNSEDIKDSNIYIITVPTPIDQFKSPDLKPLLSASAMVGKWLKKDDVVIYESTVYPGCTEHACVPALEKSSGLKFNIDFFAGYSPERINPGDKEHTITKILKVTSGSTPQTAEIVDQLYRSIIIAGTHKAPSIKVAEAAKVIENSQRDINIAFVNELSKIFNLLGINTNDVLEAAGTKWNFLKFRPGLVGGHCIGVDPYYLAQKAQEVGYHPEIILAGRRLNDDMGKYVASQTIKLMVQKDIRIKNAHILILGFTFKENCPDVRNTRVIDVIAELNGYKINVTVVDPWANPKDVYHEYNIKSTKQIPDTKFDAVILAVAHREFEGIIWADILNKNSVVYDVKGILPKTLIDGSL